MEEKTKLKDLSFLCKLGVIGGAVTAIVYGFSLLIGFVIGMIEIMMGV